MASQVVTVTVNPTIDVAMTVDRLVPDHKLKAGEYRRDPGGGGVNVSRALQRLGVGSDTWMAVGGAVGDELVALLTADGLTAVVHPIHGNTRESFALVDRSTGQQYRVITDGPTIADPASMHDAVVAAAEGAEVVVLSGMLADGLPPDFFALVAREVSAPIVVIDTFDVALPPVVEGTATVVKPSRRELEALVGRPLADRREVEDAAREVLRRGDVGTIIVSLGADGALLVPRAGPAHHRRAPLLTGATSTVGSGDALVAGIVAAVLAGHDLVDALDWGVAAGTSMAVTPGTELFGRDDFDRFLRELEEET